jgi:hypothetical protein
MIIKKFFYYLLPLIMMVSFLYGQEVLSKTLSEEQNAQSLSLTEPAKDNELETALDENLTISDKPIKEETFQEKAISENESLTLKPLSSDKLISPKDLKIPVPKEGKPHKNSFLAVFYSTLVPGLGHAYLGDYKTAGTIFGSSALGCGALLNDHTATFGVFTIETAMFYGIFAAYRDVRLYNNNFGCSYKMPTDSFKELCYAPFNYKVLKKPEVWGGLLADFAIVAGMGYLFEKLDRHISRKISSEDTEPLIAFQVGISEEALFRGYLQSFLSETFSPAGGIILSSLAFGAAHIPNAKDMDNIDRKRYYSISIPYITLSGAYYGWVTYKNHSLQQSVALHSWYDFILFTLDRVFERTLIHSAIMGKPSFSFSFSF